MNKNQENIFLFPREDGNLLYHLGTGYISAYLKAKGVEARQFVNNQSLSLSEIVAAILRQEPHCVGFSVYDANYFLVKELSQQIKQKAPEIIIIAGGPTSTFSARQIMKDTPEIDICVRGEGEAVCFELIEQLRAKKRWLGQVRGITYRNGKELITTSQRPLLKASSSEAALDILPSPYLSGIFNIKDLIKINQQQLPLITSRGCIYKCTYCNFSAMSRHTLRLHSPQRVIAELKFLDSYRREGLYFEVVICDDTFTLNPKRVKEICHGIIKEDIKLRLVEVEARADSVDREVLELLFEAGVRELNFGLESSSPRVLYNVKKVRLRDSQAGDLLPEKRFVRKVKENVRIAKEIGFQTSVSVIFGLPQDTKKRAQETLGLVKRLGVDSYSHNILNIHTGTALSRNYKQYGIKKAKRGARFLFDTMLSPLGFSYDARKLPHLDNEQSMNTRRRGALSMLGNSISGIYKRKDNHGYPEVVFIHGDDFHSRQLKRYCALQTNFIYGRGLEFKEKKATFAVGVEVSYLHPKYSVVCVSQLLKSIPGELIFDFSVDYLKNFSSGKREPRIYLIRDKIDLLELQARSGDTDKGYDIGFLEREKKDCLILDACRWSSCCAALSLKRMILDPDGNIRACFDSPIVGNLNDEPCYLKERIHAAYLKKSEERGCKYCAAKDTCSRCPFLPPAIEQEYCRMRKNNTGMNSFINALQISRKLDYLCGVR